jgi:hypothetical protein
VDVLVRKYAPLPRPSLSWIITRLRYAVPQWRSEIRPAIERATRRLAQARIDDLIWYWPADESLPKEAAPDRVHLLAPFDPVVWDRRRFEQLWGWAYRFEAYTPVAKRKMGYYALPLLWRDRVIGWGNVSAVKGAIRASFGYVGRRPRERQFTRALDEELDRLKAFLDMRA